jgi:hypothetical protein
VLILRRTARNFSGTIRRSPTLGAALAGTSSHNDWAWSILTPISRQIKERKDLSI